MNRIDSPDCRDQNHQKCPADAWDEAHDHATDCQCACHAPVAIIYTTPVVIELGEDCDDWMVTGAASHDLALGAVALWLIDAIGFLDAMEDYLPNLVEPKAEFRTDWAWIPTNDEFPDEEAPLTWGEDVPAGTTTFEGLRVTL